MAKKQTFRIQDLLGLLNGLYPPDLSEEWDNVGVQVGDPAASLTKVLVALDPSEEAVEQARAKGCQALLTHHPLILRPITSITPADETGRVARAAIRHGVTIVAAHTNLDSAAGGLNDWLAARLNLQTVEPLAVSRVDLVKLVVFVPGEHAQQVAAALFRAGAGQIGNYDRCSFRVEGVGTFRPGKDTQPYLGTAGTEEQVEEVRIETILPRRLSGKVVDKLCKEHPYEEVAYDLYPLHNRLSQAGLGRIGRLEKPTTLGAFARQVKGQLGVEAVRLVGAHDARVRKVAVCGGSGASLLAEADRRGADVLVTGDLKYHEARQAEQRGLAVIDAGHFGTEHLAVGELVRVLGQQAESHAIDIEFIEMEGEKDPFRVV